jgi:hypothetical protein
MLQSIFNRVTKLQVYRLLIWFTKLDATQEHRLSDGDVPALVV